MRFATVHDRLGIKRVGVVSEDGTAIHLLEELGYGFPDMIALIREYSGETAADIARQIRGTPGTLLSGLTLDAPLPRPSHDILSLGLNYQEHAREAARSAGQEYKRPEHAIYFSKRVDRLIPHGGKVPAHADLTDKLDYEAELAVVIGKQCDHVMPGDVYDHVFGYTIVNDISARDLQERHVLFTFGKSLDGFTCMGPWIVTKDEIPDPDNLRIVSRVNGEARQDGTTKDFIFTIPHIISELSSGIVLEPGEVIITGTPAGVGMGMTPPCYLKPGDTVECEIPSIGILRNTIVE